MKKIILLTIIMFGYIYSNAQDKIYFTDGNQVEVKILEVNTNDVKYKKHSNIEGPTYTKDKSEIHMIVYQNGENEIFKEDTPKDIYVSKKSVKEESFRKNRIYIQVVSLSSDGTVLIPNIAFELISSKSKWGHEFSIDYRSFSTTSDEINILRLGGANNYYKKGNGKGFYVGPAASLAFISYSDYNGSIDFTALDIGGQIGGQFQLSSSFGLNIRGKLGYLLPFESGYTGAFYSDILAGVNFSF